MEQKTIQVDVVSPEGSVYSGSVAMLVIKGSDGELGISSGHAQLLTSLPPGPARLIALDGSEEVLFVSGGVLEVQPDQVSVLADTVVRPQDVNETAALEAKKAAEEALKSKGANASMKTRHDLAEALAKLQVLQMIKDRRQRRG